MTAQRPTAPPPAETDAAVLPAIDVREVTKRYLRSSAGSSLVGLLSRKRAKPTEHLALRDFDLRLQPGETVGILGHNGAGKTTLLRLLAGVSQPSAGSVRVRGRIAPLISVGVGFHQEMSGRENVLMNGMLLGLTKAEVEAAYDEIVAFSELEGVLDTPVKFYSSGMMMRLGFSVAMHVRPDVLLVDEVLAVGDIAFQLKCFDRMRDLQRGGTTIVLVSHSVHAVRLLCPRAIVVNQGRKVFDGASEQAVAIHHDLLSKTATAVGSDDAHGDGPAIEFLERRLTDRSGGVPTELEAGQRYRLTYQLRFNRPVDSPQVFFTVTSETGQVAYHLISAVGDAYRRYEVGEEACVDVDFDAAMAGGTYALSIQVLSADARQVLAHDVHGLLTYRPPRLGTVGIAELNASIALDGHVLSDHDPLTLG